MKRTLPTHHAALVLLSLSACLIADKNLGDLASTSGGEETSGGSTGDASMTSNASMPETGGTETGEGEECNPDAPMACSSDPDRDGFGYACDNADERFNPDQSDIDSDGVGDVIDLCPTVAGENNSGDSDSDGIGNACDSCRYTPQQYNDVSAVPVPAALQVRNIPDVGDADGDGIGDACDNCVVIANCEAFDLDNPWSPGDPIASDDPNVCQRDDDMDMIGDACAGMQLPGAAGPVGFGDDDDFDQDGLSNFFDACARLPLPPTPCDGNEDCPLGTQCVVEAGLCNHRDVDGEGVGDACDTCPFRPNSDQVIDGGSVADDEDGDFIGEICELVGASIVVDPLPMTFWSASSSGRCCTRELVTDEMTGDLTDAVTGMQLLDPDGLPIRRECDEPEDSAQRTCRRLPDVVAEAAGILAAPLGCDGPHGEAVTLDDVGGDLAALWQTRCELPQLDQDFDGIADAADLCPFAFDPENIPYIDDDGMVWPSDGKYCNGAYSLDALCGG